MVLVAGPEQISWKLLRAYLGQSRISLASWEELLQVTGYELGAVAPFGLPAPLRILIDERVLEPEVISFGSSVRGTAVILKPGDMVSCISNAEFGRFIRAN